MASLPGSQKWQGQEVKAGVIRPQRVRGGSATAGTGPYAVSGTLKFGGGQVIEGQPRVYLVFVGSLWGAPAQSSDGYTTFTNDPSGEAPILQALYAGLGSSDEDWSRGIGEYCDGIPTGSAACSAGTAPSYIQPPASGGALVEVDYLNSSTYDNMSSDDLYQTALLFAGARSLNSSDHRSQIVLASAHGSNPDGFLTSDACAWHGAVNVPFTNLPYVTDRSFCDDQGSFGVAQIASHEYVEALTDPFPSNGWGAAPGTIRYTDGSTNSSGDSEVGDLCQRHTPVTVTLTTGVFKLATYWSNAFQECVGLPSRVLIVGDSITNGMIGDYTWRYRLMQNAQADGTDIRFVGSRVGTYDMYASSTDGAYRAAFSNSAHDSLWGWTMASAKSEIGAEVATYRPTYVVIALGFNDLAFLTNATGAEAELSEMVASARAANPDVKIAVTTIIQRSPLAGWPSINVNSSQYNAALPALVASLTTARSPVSVADVAADYAPAVDSWDGLHPNSIGEYVIAHSVSRALGVVGLNMSWHLGTPSTVDVIALVAPTLALHNTPSGVSLTWNHVYGASGYYVYNVQADGSVSRLPLPIAADNYLDRNVLPNGTYGYAVSAVRGAAESARSAAQTIAAAPLTLPAPSGITDTPSSGGITVSWQASSGATGYQVSWYDTDASFLRTQTTTPATLQIASGQVVAGHHYAVSVAAVNQYGSGPAGGGPPVVAGHGTPSAAVLVSAVQTDLHDATLSWSAVAGAAGYQIWQQDWTQSSATWVRLPYAVSGTSFTAGLLPAAYRYQFKITAVNGSLVATESNVVKATPLPLAAPNVTAVAGARQVTLSWVAIPNDDGLYWVWAADLTAGQALARLPFPVSGLTFTHSPLTSGHVYQYRIGGNEGPYTGPLSPTVTATPS